MPSKMDSLEIMWKRYMNYFIVGNHELKEIFFYNFTGTILTYRKCGYTESARNMSTRIHVWAFQDSGTGKGEVLKATFRLLQHLNVPSRYTQKDNEACLVGTVYMDTFMKDKKVMREVKMKQGLLAELFWLGWDEGRVLLQEGSSYMDTLTDELQGVMDEPGWISKGMRLGTIEYPSPTSVSGGSYLFPGFKQMLFVKGFMQRTFLSYKNFTEKEKHDIRIGIQLLKKNTDYQRVRDLQDAIKKIIESLPRDKVLTFDPIAVDKFTIIAEEVFQKYVSNQFVGEKQKIYETFFNRFHHIVDRIAAQKALVDGRDTICLADMEYGLEKAKWHLTSLQQIFDFLERDKVVTAPDDRMKQIMNHIKQTEGKIDKAVLIETLSRWKEAGNWDLGYNRTRLLIDKMLERGLIFEDSQDSNRKVLIIKPITVE